MSMHKIPLSDIERKGLEAHGLAIGTPSQLADVFRQGVAWANAQKMVLPQRKPVIEGNYAYDPVGYGNNKVWNECLDEVVKLNNL